jgi:hypothetical protein
MISYIQHFCPMSDMILKCVLERLQVILRKAPMGHVPLKWEGVPIFPPQSSLTGKALSPGSAWPLDPSLQQRQSPQTAFHPVARAGNDLLRDKSHTLDSGARGQ